MRLYRKHTVGFSLVEILVVLAVIGLVGIAVHQIYRGNIVGPAIPILLSALNLTQQISNPVSDTNQ